MSNMIHMSVCIVTHYFELPHTVSSWQLEILCVTHCFGLPCLTCQFAQRHMKCRNHETAMSRVALPHRRMKCALPHRHIKCATRSIPVSLFEHIICLCANRLVKHDSHDSFTFETQLMQNMTHLHMSDNET